MIWTQIWDDEWFRDLNSPSKYLFLFLLTNPEVNLVGMYRINREKLRYYTKLTDSQLDTCFINLSGKVKYHDGWIIIKKYQEYNPYKGPSNETAKDKEMDLIPQNIKELAKSTFNDTPPTGSGDGVHTSTNTNTITNTNNIRVVKGNLTQEDFQEIAENYQVPLGFVLSKWDDIQNYCASTGKKYKDYKATLRNWVKKDSMQIRKEEHGKSKIGIVTPDPSWKNPR